MRNVLKINGNMNVAENVIRKNTYGVKEGEFDIIPCNLGVLIEFYSENPYRRIEQTKSGLFVGVESTKMYKSNETGEYEYNDEVVSCAKVIAVGPKCENVHVGEDIYVIRHVCNPIPFRKKGYYLINEANILCRVIEK